MTHIDVAAAVALKFRGQTLDAIAKNFGCSVSTVQRALRSAEGQTFEKEMRDATRSEVFNRMMSEFSATADRLIAFARDEEKAFALRANTVFVNILIKLSREVDIAARLQALEDTAARVAMEQPSAAERAPSLGEQPAGKRPEPEDEDQVAPTPSQEPAAPSRPSERAGKKSGRATRGRTTQTVYLTTEEILAQVHASKRNGS